ncbi:hypothetical protein F3X89_03755 [Rhizobium rhizogenes]|uniref:hypothetical protein n=1 Tax=Rhizobium rhizogenes TaxID=359 RepID=UPI00193D723C|nr:hypothetical protein [Rhizobium rhizogenes]QRM36951.1 hypothetical protein F3X89_03755 [Rhizobium rhizogenes]
MTPDAAIAMLNRQLTRHGKTVTVMRGTPDVPSASQSAKGFVRGDNATDIAGQSGITQRLSTIVLSPTDFAAWPAPLPEKGDWCTVAGQTRQIIEFDHIAIDDVVVRIELTVED